MSETEAIKFLESFYDTVPHRHNRSSISKEAFIEDMKRESEAWGNGFEWFIEKKFFCSDRADKTDKKGERKC